LQSLTFYSIYGSNLSTDRRLLWQQLINLRLSIQGPWLAAGDFHTVRTVGEKMGGRVPFLTGAQP